jgi:hypothetical protein
MISSYCFTGNLIGRHGRTMTELRQDFCNPFIGSR